MGQSGLPLPGFNRWDMYVPSRQSAVTRCAFTSAGGASFSIDDDS